MKYPNVLDERATVQLLIDGRRSLARFGDGEFKLMVQSGASPGQRYVPALRKRLLQVAACTDDRLVVAAPRIYERIPTHMRRSWRPWLLSNRIPKGWRGRTLGSAFVSRPDFYGTTGFGEPYWQAMRSIWDGRPLLAVRGVEHAKGLELFDNAASILVGKGPCPNAWAKHAALLEKCLEWAAQEPDGVVALMLGPTATVLAHDLALQGVQALDLGKAPRFYRREMRT